MYYMTTFSDWLAKQLEDRKMSSSDLARESHKAPAVISRILRGETNPAPHTIKDIAGALKMPVDTVFRAVVGLPDQGDGLTPKKRELLHMAEQADDETVELILDVLRSAAERRRRQVPNNGQMKKA